MAGPNEMIADRVLPWRRLGVSSFGICILIGMAAIAVHIRRKQLAVSLLFVPLLLFGWWIFASRFRSSIRAFRGIKKGTSARSVYDMQVNPGQQVLLGPIETGQRFDVFFEPLGLEYEAGYKTHLTLDVLSESGNVVRSMTTRRSNGNGMWNENGFGVKSRDDVHFLRLTITTENRTENYQFDFAVEISTKKSLPKLPKRWETTNV
ncbi:MAG: hypothetical protein KDA20_01730 [Phycisphaerales bacterium]|nr:hypothetical protein [Phycisphaerales bacterium]